MDNLVPLLLRRENRSIWSKEFRNHPPVGLILLGFDAKLCWENAAKVHFPCFNQKKDIPEHTKPVSCESFRVFDPYPHLSLLIRVPTFRSLLFWSFFSNNFTKAGKPA